MKRSELRITGPGSKQDFDLDKRGGERGAEVRNTYYFI